MPVVVTKLIMNRLRSTAEISAVFFYGFIQITLLKISFMLHFIIRKNVIIKGMDNYEETM